MDAFERHVRALAGKGLGCTISPTDRTKGDAGFPRGFGIRQLVSNINGPVWPNAEFREHATDAVVFSEEGSAAFNATHEGADIFPKGVVAVFLGIGADDSQAQALSVELVKNSPDVGKQRRFLSSLPHQAREIPRQTGQLPAWQTNAGHDFARRQLPHPLGLPVVQRLDPVAFGERIVDADEKAERVDEGSIQIEYCQFVAPSPRV